MLNRASRRRSAVGRIACDFGATDLGAALRGRADVRRRCASARLAACGPAAAPLLPPRPLRLAHTLGVAAALPALAELCGLEVRAFVPFGRPLVCSLSSVSTRRHRRASAGSRSIARPRKIRASQSARPARRAARARSASAPPRSAPSAISPSWNGPNDTRIRRLTASPRWPSTFFTSRFLPSRIAKVSQTLAPCARSTVASIDP